MIFLELTRKVAKNRQFLPFYAKKNLPLYVEKLKNKDYGYY